MYDTFTEWRNEIRRLEKALRLMKQAQEIPQSQIGSYWRADLNRAVEEIERTILRAKASYAAEKGLLAKAK